MELVPLSTIHISEGDYADYYAGYVANIKPSNFESILKEDIAELGILFSKLDENNSTRGYAPGKWSIKEVIQHCIDVERIFSSRALMIARGEQQSIQGFDHDAYVLASRANERKLAELEAEWKYLRNSTRALFRSFDESDFSKAGITNGNHITIGAILYVIPGHNLHHMKVIQEKYDLS